MIGIVIGALPGLHAGNTLPLLLPLTFAMSPVTGLVFLCAIYTASEYGGSISAITLAIPGTPAAIATVFDGYPLARQGQMGKALGMSLYASTAGGLLSTVFLVLLSVPLAHFALRFGPAEQFALGVFSLTIIVTLAERNLLKGFIATLIGLFLGTFGADALTGHPRFTFGSLNLYNGIDFVTALLGLFGVSEVLVQLESVGTTWGDVRSTVERGAGTLPTLAEMRARIVTILRGSFIGLVVGALPGAGGTIAAIIAYNEEKRASRHPERFGTGLLEGVAAPESANNATVGGALIPTLTLGIPGSGAAAILIGALQIQGLMPGPELFSRNADMVFGLFASLFVSNLVMLGLGQSWIRSSRHILAVPPGVVMAVVLALSILGGYALHNSLFEAGLVVAFGIAGYLLRKLEFPLAPIVFALLLGPMVEINFRRALVISRGSALTFVSEPLSLILLLLAAGSLAWSLWRVRRP